VSRIRITGGQWRSRLLDVASLRGLRPTPDRVRETLFNWLGQDLSGLHCLDLFAGTGALGFEAASRGAARVTLVENDPSAFAALRNNAQRLGAPGLELVRADAVKFAGSLVNASFARPTGEPVAASRYDVVFLDPPYHQGLLEKIEPFLDRLANPDARLYVEAERAVAGLGPWLAVRQGRAGQVHYHLLERP